MNNFADRRSVAGNGKGTPEDVADLKRPHRVGPGVRTSDQFFKNLDRAMTRGDYLKVHAMHEYHRREQAWWRRLYRYVRGWPKVAPLNERLAAVHARQLWQLRERLEAEAEPAAEDHSHA